MELFPFAKVEQTFGIKTFSGGKDIVNRSYAMENEDYVFLRKINNYITSS